MSQFKKKMNAVTEETMMVASDWLKEELNSDPLPEPHHSNAVYFKYITHNLRQLLLAHLPHRTAWIQCSMRERQVDILGMNEDQLEATLSNNGRTVRSCRHVLFDAQTVALLWKFLGLPTEGTVPYIHSVTGDVKWVERR